MDLERSITETVSKIYETKLLNIVKKGNIPKHVAIIMDGNRRYAHEIGLDPTMGHVKGRDKLEEFLNWCMELGIKVVTVFAFSTENFRRSEWEVRSLMNIFKETIQKELEDKKIHENRVKIRFIGRRDLIPDDLKEQVEKIEKVTENYDNYILNIAIAYGGREEILKAIREIAFDVKNNLLKPEEIDEDVVRKHLYTGDLPDPDLILRTSGEERVSNFLLWQMAYSELYFTDVYWPEFSKIDFLRAILSYQRRSRRFGT